MKSLKHKCYVVISIISLLFIGSCTSVKIISPQSSTDISTNEEIIFYENNSPIPDNLTKIGTLKVGKVSLSEEIALEKLQQKAKDLCRTSGGNALQITSYHKGFPLGLITIFALTSRNYKITANILKAPPKQYVETSVEKNKLSQDNLISSWDTNGTDFVEGIYEKISDGTSAKYTLAIKKQDNGYDVIYLKGELPGQSFRWSEGDLKGKLIKTATPNLYKVDWYMPEKSLETNLYITFEEGLMSIIWTNGKDKELYLKLYPTETSKAHSNIPKAITGISTGTAFALNNKGYLVTNYHVIEGSKNVYIKGVDNDFKTRYKTEVVLTDKNNDIAILKINDERIKTYKNPPYQIKIPLSNVGENVFALGYPLRNTMGNEVKLTNGIISSRSGYKGDLTFYQVSVPIQSGNSGGPLFNNEGNIIGIMSAAHANTENVSYAIKTSYLSNLIQASGEDINMNETNIIADKNLTEQVKVIRNFVYMVECEIEE